MHRILLPTAPRAAFSSILLLCAVARAAEPAPTPESRAHFKAGVDHLDHGRYEEAYRELNEAYAITPRWTVLGNLGIAAEHLERDGEAIDRLKQYMERGGSELGPKEVRKLRSTMGDLEKRSASVTLEAPGTFWIIDTRIAMDQSVVNEYGPFDAHAKLRVRAGQHELKLDRNGMGAPPWTVTLEPGDVASHVFEKEPAPEIVETLVSEPEPPLAEPVADLPEPSHTASYVLWGVGAAGAVAATLVALEANSIQNTADVDFAQACSQAPAGEACPPTTDDDRKAAHWRTAALVTGVGALGALAAGTVLYFLDKGSHPAESTASVEPWVSPTGIGVSGTF